MGYELEGIVAAVLGGVSINGGEGNIVNVMIGALTMGVLRNGLNLFRVNSFWQMAITGFILVVACAVEARRRRRSGSG
jgi:ribose transport system permease protein